MAVGAGSSDRHACLHRTNPGRDLTLAGDGRASPSPPPATWSPQVELEGGGVHRLLADPDVAQGVPAPGVVQEPLEQAQIAAKPPVSAQNKIFRQILRREKGEPNSPFSL